MLDSQQLAGQQSAVVTGVRVQLLVRVSGLSVSLPSMHRIKLILHENDLSVMLTVRLKLRMSVGARLGDFPQQLWDKTEGFGLGLLKGRVGCLVKIIT